ncbi:MAG: DHA2 family efflux MFS transporter permease subunit [Candidatus Gastranaerophilales bacterium]|nr:DHA2 family efflux MFS transporter permease subunit [Candidatus Gastranaerophilales bacterium]
MEATQQQTEWKPKSSLLMITIACMLATFVEVLNTSIANVALKYIAGSYSISNDESLWIVTIFLIACSILLPATDWCCTVFGRKKFFLFCIALFGISAMVCGLAPNFETMIIGRIFQGLGGGCLLPLSQAILLESYPKEEQPKAMAIFSTGITIAPIIAPIIGGWLTSNLSWNYVFFISVPFCIAAFVMVMLHIEDPPYLKIQKNLEFDYVGMILLIIWIATFQVAIDNGQKNGWFDSEYIRNLGITSLIAFISLIWWELKAKKPLLDLKIFKNWNFTFGTIVLTMLFGVAYGTITMLPQFLQNVMGYDSLLSGLAAGPMGFGTMSGVMFCAITSKTMDLRHQMLFGIIVFSIGCLMFSGLNLDIALPNVIVPNIVLGVGMTSIIIPGTTLLFSTVLKEEMTNASSIQNLIKNVGCAVGTSSVGFLVSSYSQVYQSYLVDKLTPLNEIFYGKIMAMQAQFINMGMDANTAFGAAQGKVYGQLIQQSTLCAFMNAYRLYAIAIIILIPFVFILRKFEGQKS